MTVIESPAVREFVRCAENGWQQGWHERNGGNLSCRLRGEDIAGFHKEFNKNAPWVPFGVEVPNLAGACFLVTGTNRYFQNILRAPEENIGIVELNEQGDAYRLLWGLTAGRRPTSEFATHCMNHAVRVRVTNGASRVIYHAHPVNVIALTFVLPLTARDVTRALWQAMTECAVVFPEGVSVVPWMVCGGAEIARVTAKEMERRAAVIWAQHGLFCAGEDYDSTFGMMHAIEKAADIYLKVLASGKPVLQTITDDHLRQLAAAFGLRLDETFLD
jgi:rhamnulose-1-phosphate aldolase